MKKVTFIEPLSKHNTLSSQLKKLTGDEFSMNNFRSYHAPDSVLPAGVIVHQKTGQQFFVPFNPHPEHNNQLDCIKEIMRITKFSGGKGGYQWGDTQGPDGKYGKENLDLLEGLGLAKRTGRQVENQLGGTWPEVQVTDLGKSVVEGYLNWRLGCDVEPNP